MWNSQLHLATTSRGRGPSRHRARRRSLRLESLEPRAMLDGATASDPDNPHTDPEVAADHASLLSLVPYAAITHSAVQSGQWDDPATWDHGIPSADANVLIPANVDVVLDSIELDRLRTVRVDGELSFATDTDTQLTVDTLVVAPSGALEIGMAEEPISPDVTARILIADRGDIDTHWDPTHLSRGLISHGHVSMYGSEVTSYVPVTTSLAAGATTIALAQVPVGWKAGDRVVLTGSQYGEHDELMIQSISGQAVTVAPLTYDHILPEAGLSLYLANVSRNVVIESENAKVVARRGHVMFMHSPDADVNNVGFYGLGRTDKRYDLNSGKLDETGQLIDGTGLNQVGRYSVHFHHTGIEPGAAAAHIRGSAVVGSPGWGIASHHSNVIADDNVVFDAFGAAFATEAGDEIGAFRGNLAIHSTGSGETTESRGRNAVPEFAHEGVGFWMQGSGVDVTDNIAVGHRIGFVLYGQGLIEDGVRTTFPAYNLKDPAWAGRYSAVNTGSFPIQFSDNTTFASRTGLSTRYHREVARSNDSTSIDRFIAWNVENGVATHYTFRVDFNDLKLLGNASRDSRSGFVGSGVTSQFTINGGRIEGFWYGASLPERGANRVENVHLANVRNLSISTRSYYDSETTIDNVTLEHLAIGPRSITPYDIYVKPLPTASSRELASIFRDVSPTFFGGQELYRPEQAGHSVLFAPGTPSNQAPAEFVGKTNQQLFDEYGIALGGAVAPSDATPMPQANALIGSVFQGRSTIQQVSPSLVDSADYTLAYRTSRGGPVVTESGPTTLQTGWNVLTRQIDGAKYSFLVYADIAPPSFSLKLNAVLAIHPDDLEKAFVFRGTIEDDFDSTSFQAAFRLDSLPVQTRSDGSRFVEIQFIIRDRAGNEQSQRLQIDIDANAPRIVVDSTTVVIDPLKTLSATLKALLVTVQA